MGLIARLRAYGGVMGRAKRPLDVPRLLRRRPALLLCGRVEARLKSLAQIKTSALVGCPF